MLTTYIESGWKNSNSNDTSVFGELVLDGQLVNAGPFVLQEALFKNDLDLTFGDSQLRTAAACFYNATIF